VVPVRYKTPWDVTRNAAREAWQQERLTPQALEHEFTGDVTGCGVILGEPSENLSDLDLDCPEALAVAEAMLPALGCTSTCIFGRPSSPRSHYIHRTDRPLETRRYKDVDPKRTTVLERRGTGAQTVFPHALHESGECVRFDKRGEPTRVTAAVLERAADLIAATTLLARHWPQGPGSRHDLALAVAGYLLRGGLPDAEVRVMLETAARVAGDEEARDRIIAVFSTVRALASGRRATGGPTLVALLGNPVVERLDDWLGLRSAGALVDIHRSAGTETPADEADQEDTTLLIPAFPPCPGRRRT
jgi:hypothetical protein